MLPGPYIVARIYGPDGVLFLVGGYGRCLLWVENGQAMVSCTAETTGYPALAQAAASPNRNTRALAGMPRVLEQPAHQTQPVVAAFDTVGRIVQDGKIIYFS